MWDPVWEEVFSSQAWGQYPGEDLIRFVARNFYRSPERSAIRILEVGCGPGANLWYLAREGFSFAGIDGSPTAIDQARLRLDKETPGWAERSELVVGDIGSLPFPDASFDAVLDSEAVYCNDYSSSQAIYAEMSRILKPGGKLYSRTFARGSWGDETGTCVGKDYWLCAQGPLAGKGPSRFTGYEDIPNLVHGFTVEDVELISRSMNGRQEVVSEWIISGKKA